MLPRFGQIDEEDSFSKNHARTPQRPREYAKNMYPGLSRTSEFFLLTQYIFWLEENVLRAVGQNVHTYRILDFFFPDTASIHTYLAYPYILKSTLQGRKQ